MSGAVLTVAQMRRAERAAVDAGVSEQELMERAGRSAALWAARMAAGRRICVLCGPGNNGGDGYVLARVLLEMGAAVTVAAPRPPQTAAAQHACAQYSGEISTSGLPDADVYADCLFGYGLSRKVEGKYRALLQALAATNAYKIAVDVPSSAQSDSGALLGPEVVYDLTLALGCWKRAHFMMPAAHLMGALRCVDIGIDTGAATARASAAPALEKPAARAHKYTRGMIGVVAGVMPGAALLSCDAALRSGAGYVKLLSNISHPGLPADLVVDEAPLAAALQDTRLAALLAGPGLGRGEEAQERLSQVLAAQIPAVLDADALHLLTPGGLASAGGTPIAITPHEGELAALCGAFGISEDGKIAQAEALHEKTGLAVLAKGPDTVLAGQSGLRFFSAAPSWLSVAGSGDVLAGIAASRLAVHGHIEQALEEAFWIHREAAFGAGPAFTAGDLARGVNLALETFL